MRKSFRFRTLWISLFLITNSLLISGQTLVYEGFIRGHKVGEMKVVREVTGDQIDIDVSTHIEAHLLVKIEVDYVSSSIYKNKQLIESEAQTRTNGHLKETVEIKRIDKGYSITDNGRRKNLNKAKVQGADLYYFELPKEDSELISLATGEALKVVRDNATTFSFEHDGKSESHVFKSGVLQELNISHKLYTIVFKKKN